MLPILVFILRVVMVLVLYAFLFWVVVTLWNDLKFHSEILSQRKAPPLDIVIEGEQRTEKFTFTQNEILFGREPNCDISLTDPAISGRHAKMVYRNMHWWIEDLLSTNGTYLNDERIESPAILINGDEVRIGNNILIVEIQQVK